MIRVAVIDDDALIRESLAILLEGKEGISIVGQGKTGWRHWHGQTGAM